jgi:hypothetical protein
MQHILGQQQSLNTYLPPLIRKRCVQLFSGANPYHTIPQTAPYHT